MHNTTSLPRDLRSELGIRDTYGEKKRKQKGPATRKDRRRAERNDKKSRKPVAPARKFQRIEEDEEDDDEDAFDLNEDDDFSSDDARPAKKSKCTPEARPKPASKTTKVSKKGREPASDSGSEEAYGDTDEDDMDEDIGHHPEVLPESPVHVSAAVKSKLAQDDAEIAALEKKLGLKKGRKLPKAFAEDGLDDLMGDLGEESEDDSRKRKREADEWLLSKRRKAQALQAQGSEDEEDEDEDEDDEELDSEEDGDNLDDEIFGHGSDDEAEDEGSDFEGFDERLPPKKKENPYVAPVSKPEATQKYIPPSLRARQDPESESLTRLRRQAQGQLNKLSEANLISIVAEFEKLYRDYPRQNVTSTLINLLMGMICERAVLQDTFMVLHAGFIAALYKLMGMDFGAELVQHVVEILDAGGDERGKFEGKETINLVSLLSQLYNFHVIGSTLMFDYIRLFLEEITETNTELLLKVIRSK
jgi:nucleolar MIF4G domain-containing protein 1